MNAAQVQLADRDGGSVLGVILWLVIIVVVIIVAVGLYNFLTGRGRRRP